MRSCGFTGTKTGNRARLMDGVRMVTVPPWRLIILERSGVRDLDAYIIYYFYIVVKFLWSRVTNCANYGEPVTELLVPTRHISWTRILTDWVQSKKSVAQAPRAGSATPPFDSPLSHAGALLVWLQLTLTESSAYTSLFENPRFSTFALLTALLHRKLSFSDPFQSVGSHNEKAP